MASRYKVTLTEAERAELEAISSKGSHQSQKIISALILLNCDKGEFNEKPQTGQAIADMLHVSLRKIDRLKKQFVEEGLDAALGRRQRQEPSHRKVDGKLEAKIIAMACSKPPEGFANWTLRLLADKVVELGYVDSMSYETVRRTLKKTNLNLGKT